MKKKGKIYIIAALLAASFFRLPAQAVGPEEEGQNQPMESQVLILEVPKEQTVSLHAEQLERQLGLGSGELRAASFPVVPTGGKLLVDGVAVSRGDTLLRSELDRLCYAPEGAGAGDWFAMTPACGKSVCTAVNLRPVEEERQEPSLKNDHCVTARNMAVHRGAETDTGSRLVVTQQGRKGFVSVDGTAYTYTPYPDAAGRDRFSILALDEGGRCSKEAWVTVDIERKAPQFTFDDMKGSPSEYAVVKLCEVGVLSGERMGGALLFHPERPVTTGEFLVMLESATGDGSALPLCVNTGLGQDSQIPFWMKPYVKKALSQGLLSQEDDLLSPISRARAVDMVRQVSGLEEAKPVGLSRMERSFLPAWAAASYQTLSAHRMLELHGESADPQEPLTRAAAADLLLPLLK